MKVLSKICLLAGFAVVLLSTPMIADTVSEADGKDILKEEFYFPEFDDTMESFWQSMEPLHNSCSARSWLGGYASSTCLSRQNCVCTTTFVSAECHCENV